MYQGETDLRISTNNMCADGDTQTERHVLKHPSGDQLLHNSSSILFHVLPLLTPVLCMEGRLLFEEMLCTTPGCPCLVFFCSSVPLQILSLYIVSHHILTIISHVQHWVHPFAIWNIRWDAFSPHWLWKDSKSHVANCQTGDCNSTELLTRSDWLQGVHILHCRGATDDRLEGSRVCTAHLKCNGARLQILTGCRTNLMNLIVSYLSDKSRTSDAVTNRISFLELSASGCTIFMWSKMTLYLIAWVI